LSKAYKHRELHILSVVHGATAALIAGSFGLLSWATFVFWLGTGSPILRSPGLSAVAFVGIILVLFLELLLVMTRPGRQLGATARLRTALIIGFFAYGVGSLIVGTGTEVGAGAGTTAARPQAATPNNPTESRWGIQALRPNPINIALPLFLAMTFSLTASIHQPFVRREKLIGLFEGQKEADLLQLLQEEHPQILLAYDEVRGINRTASGVLFLTLVYHGGLAVSGTYPPVGSGAGLYLVLTALTMLGVFLVWALGNSYLDDHRTLSRTTLYSLEQRIHRLVLSSLVLAASLGLGWILPRDRSLFPPEVVGAFFAWIFSLFHNQPFDQPPQLDQIFTPPPPPALPRILDAETAWQTYTLGQILEFLGEVFRNALLAGAILGLLYFIFAPFFATNRWKTWLKGIQDGTTKNALGWFIRKSIILYLQLRKLTRSLFKSRQAQWTELSSSTQPILDRYLTELRTQTNRSHKRKVALGPLPALLQRYLAQIQNLGAELRPTMTLGDVTKAAEILLVQKKDQETCRLLGSIFEQLLYNPQLRARDIKKLLSQLKSTLNNWNPQPRENQD